jgi:ATP-dependent Clp protease ATP-binding subunit ClpA/ATP-dependent Clp protease ATP-binding subunit ClpC
VAQKELAKLLARPGLSSRNVFVTVADEVRAFAVGQAFDARMGARSVKRWLEENVGGRLAEALVRVSAAPMQMAQVFVRHGELRVEAQALAARERAPGRLSFEPLLKAGAPELLEGLRDARRGLDTLAQGEAFDALAEQMRFHLSRHEEGERGHAESAYALDAARQLALELTARVDALLSSPADASHDWLEMERFGVLERSSRSMGDERFRLVDRRALPKIALAPTRAQLLDALAEVRFLARTMKRAADPARHAVTLVASRFGAARSGAWDDYALVRSLAQAYAAGRGTVEGFAARRANASARTNDEGVFLDGDAAGLEKAIQHRLPAEEIAVRIAGLCVLDFFEGEAGLHVWQSLGRLPQLVQVHVLPGGSLFPRALLEERQRQREAFQRARAADGEVADPDAPLPTVRVYRFEPPIGGGVVPLEVEDYELGWATTGRGKAAVDLLPELWRLRMSREELEPAAAAGRG